MNKPKIFNWLDFFTFGMLSLAALALTVFVWFSQVQFQAKALTTVVALTFSSIYVAILIMRKKSIDSADFYTFNGWAILNQSSNTNIHPDMINAEIERTINLWKKVIEWNNDCDAAIAKNYKVIFKDGILEEYPGGIKITGNTISSKFGAFDGELEIGLAEKPIEQTAFAHEIGHVIYNGKFGILDNEKTHAYMAEHNLP